MLCVSAMTPILNLRFLCLALLTVCSAYPGRAESERFEFLNGESLKGELIGVYGGMVFVDTGRRGTSYFPFRSLKEQSQASARDWFNDYVAALDEESPRVSEVDSKLSTFLSKNLVRVEDGEFVSYDFGSEEQPEFYLFYYSAHWCGPCRRFTPKLVAFYNVMKRQGHDFELIFVSSDRSSKEMLEYMEKTKMQWPAVKFNKTENRLVSGYGGSGIPCLVVTDRNGALLFHSYAGSEYLGPSEPMKKFEKVLNSLESLRRVAKEAQDSAG